MRYKSKSGLISIPWFEEIIRETLDMYNRGNDLSHSPFTVSKVARLHKECALLAGKPLEDAMLARQRKLIQLYIAIRDDGYKNEAPMYVSFQDDGSIKLYDGFHRLAILNYLGLDVEVDLETTWKGMSPPNPPPTGRDFPLVETLLKEHPAGKWLYQPVDDPRLADFKVARTDSPQRLEYITKHLMGQSVLEIGCSEGYFSRELAKKGFKVTAIDKSEGYIAADRYLATINGLDIDYQVARWQDFLKGDVYFDNILFLSVLHNDMKFMPVEDALKGLHLFRGKCFRLFFEVPNNDKEQDWSAEKYDFLDSKNLAYISQEMAMEKRQTWKGWRPIHIMNKVASMEAISEKEWDSHNEWERQWWGTCKDTFEEQLKQATYARLMKLDQFAGQRCSFNLRGMSVLDIGGGPVSLLLRGYGYKRAVVVDPCDYPQWVMDRYSMAKIEYIKVRAEEAKFGERFDEVWLYNCLQHVQDPAAVIRMAIKNARKIRVAEVLNIGIYLGHPQNLTKEALDKLFGREGLVEERGGLAHGLFYFGVFRYE